MSKPTKEQLEARAKEVVEKFAARLVKAYPAWCVKYSKHYAELPDEDDFFAWIEGYDWSEQ